MPADFTGRNTTAEIQLDKTGRFLYVSNRDANSIAVYAVEPGKATLTLREFIPALGQFASALLKHRIFFAVLGPVELFLIALYYANASGLFLVAMSAILLIS